MLFFVYAWALSGAHLSLSTERFYLSLLLMKNKKRVPNFDDHKNNHNLTTSKK
jgi:hypothetical protein